ncbi:unnamed protein product [Meloidogyne enterolobii]|uniref:Uncharacterized protein n=1 Tax=Meloidogyne enterolobii TaxID=390850 RepID=A0ACB0YUZ7_MELEN
MSPYHLFKFRVWIFYFSKSGQRPRQFFRSQFFFCFNFLNIKFVLMGTPFYNFFCLFKNKGYLSSTSPIIKIFFIFITLLKILLAIII